MTFAHPFLLKGVDRILGAGDYRVVTDEELIEELSFPVYRRVATMIFVPADSKNASSLVSGWVCALAGLVAASRSCAS